MKLRNFFIIFLLSLFLLPSCNKEKTIVFNTIRDTYYVSLKNNFMLYEFAYQNKIKKLNVENIQTSNNEINYVKFIDSKDNTTPSEMKVKDLYLYSIFFDFSYDNFVFNSFDLIIDNNTYHINLDLNVKKIEENNSDIDDSLKSIYIGDPCKEFNLKFMPKSNIKIKKFEFINTANLPYEIYINLLPFNENTILAANELFSVDIKMIEVDRYIPYYGYIKFSYVDDKGIEYLYTSELSVFANIIRHLESKLK